MDGSRDERMQRRARTERASAEPRPRSGFVRAGLELLDLEASEAEIAVIEAADGLYRPLIDALLEAELDGVEPEPGADMSQRPRRGRALSLLDATLREQAAAVAGGDADPAELLDAALARIEERNPSVNAIVETFPEHSRRMLAEAPSGPLHGVPVAIKDEWPLPWRAERLGGRAVPRPAAEAG